MQATELGEQEIHALADTVANEIRTAFNAYRGERWQKVNGEEKAVWFTVAAPSLAGCEFRSLNHGRSDFNWRVHEAGLRYVRGCRAGTTLHGVDIKLEVVDGKYTGKVEVCDGSSAWDYDL
jgi:hypothetical protein